LTTHNLCGLQDGSVTAKADHQFNVVWFGVNAELFDRDRGFRRDCRML
jgi:hypothetical protein